MAGKLISGLMAAFMSTAASAQDSGTLYMGALGDSITRAFNAGMPLDQPERSWTTGTGGRPGVVSHRQRLESLGYRVRAANVARSGAKAVELAGQAAELLEGGVPDYVTLLIGANDVCDWPDAHQEKLGEFGNDVDAAVSALVTANPNIRILLVAIPNMLNLWEVGAANGCQVRWDTYRMCSRLLGRNVSDIGRQRFGDRLMDANSALGMVAARYPDQVRFVERAGTVEFEWEHISRIDCFHPSAAGQDFLSAESWKDGWYALD